MSLAGAAGKGGSASQPSDRVFPRSCRLTTRRQFLNVYEHGRRVTTTSFTLFGLPNSLEHCRIGLTVTRRIGGAAQRNRAKRLLREAFRGQRHAMQPPMDLVVNARHPILEAGLEQLEHELRRSFDRLGSRWRS